MKKIIAIVFILLCGVASVAAEELSYLGVMSHDCSDINKTDSKNKIPENFKLTPIEAAKTLKNNSKTGCFVKMGFGVYTDGKYYYFVNNNLLFGKTKSMETIKKYSFFIDPNTGNLVSKPKYEENT